MKLWEQGVGWRNNTAQHDATVARSPSECDSPSRPSVRYPNRPCRSGVNRPRTERSLRRPGSLDRTTLHLCVRLVLHSGADTGWSGMRELVGPEDERTDHHAIHSDRPPRNDAPPSGAAGKQAMDARRDLAMPRVAPSGPMFGSRRGSVWFDRMHRRGGGLAAMFPEGARFTGTYHQSRSVFVECRYLRAVTPY